MHTSYFYICENLHLSISEKNNNPTKCHFVINSKMHVNCPYVVLDIFNVFNGEIFFEKETHLLKNKKKPFSYGRDEPDPWGNYYPGSPHPPGPGSYYQDVLIS